MPPPRQHLVVVGVDTTAVRLVEELVRTGEEVVVLAPGGGDPDAVADVEALGARVVAAPHRVGEADLRAVGVPGARAVVLLGDDDVAALRLALVVEELAPEVRLVIEMANPRLGTTLRELIGDCTLLSPAELAGPAFVAAALATADTRAFEIGGRMVAAGPRERVSGEELAVLASSRLTGIEAVLPAGDGDVVLGTALVPPPRSDARRSGVPGALARVFDRRARVVVVGIVVLVLLSTLYFHAGGSSWLVSLYRALTTSTDTGDGDLGDLSVPFRFGAVAIQLFGLVLSAGITAVIVDALVSARLAAITGGVRGRPRRHVVVCGLGRVGTAVAAQLKARGVPVVAVERSEEVPGVLEARRLRIPVVIGPASDAAAQAVAGIARAVAVVAVTDDEAVNLEIALVARDVNPRVRVVTRMFDHELAARVERRLELGTTRSVSMLAAPAFAAAALGRRREVIFPVGRRVLLFTEVTVHAGSAAPGRSLSALAEEGVSRLLAVAPAGGGWDWQWADRPVEAGDRLAVVATRAGLARMLRATKAVRPPAGTPGT